MKRSKFPEYPDASPVERANLDPNMKSMIPKLTAALALACTFTTSIPDAKASDITLDGYGYYKTSLSERYYGHDGKKQTGRKLYLGSGYYRSTSIGMDYLTNRSGNKSGSLSFEFWAMPYYGATSGIVLMTIGTSPLSAGQSKKHFNVKGNSVLLESKRYPELNIWEYTKKGWLFRDALDFTRKSYL